MQTYPIPPPHVRNSTLGSWTKLCPERVLGGSSPVQAILRHSMTVCRGGGRREWFHAHAVAGAHPCSLNDRWVGRLPLHQHAAAWAPVCTGHRNPRTVFPAPL